MSLSKQLFIIISFIFFMIFAGTYIISIKNTKEYLQVESLTKAKDTATSLGMGLKPLLKDKNNPEIKSVISAIANSGFYKQIKLEDAFYSISDSLLINSSDILKNKIWEISNVKVEEKYGKLEKITSDEDISLQLSALESDNLISDEFLEKQENKYIFTPNKDFKKEKELEFYFDAKNEEKTIKIKSKVKLNKIIAEVNRAEKFDYVPSWFIKLVDIQLEEQESEISDGWKTTAILYISANAGDAYAKLYEQAKTSIIYSLIAFVISLFILFVFVQQLLKPLKKIERLANDIAIGKFRTIKELPKTTEVKNVAIAMNDMSTKIEEIICKLNKNLEQTTEKLSRDDLTNLAMEQSFKTDMKNMFINKYEGYVFLIKIFDLAGFAKENSNKEINSFIKKFASILELTKYESKLTTYAYRFYGSEFAIIAKNFTFEDSKNFVNKLKENFEKLSNEFSKKDVVHIGATPFNPIATTSQMLQAANEAYEKATLIGSNECFISDTSSLSRDMQAWKILIFDIIDNSKFQVNFIQDSFSLKNNTLVMQEAFTSAFDNEGNKIPIGTFVSIAEKYEKIIDFDKKVVLKIIDYIVSNKIKHEICVNLSLESINNTAFVSWLENVIKENNEISSSLVFSLSAYAAAKDIDKFKFFVDEMHGWKTKVIVKRFESKFIPLDRLKDFNLDYIRLSRNYTQSIAADPSKQSFIESISQLANLLNIKIYAENVEDEEDLEIIKASSIYAASR